jgi:uncharacterized protein YcaQ
MAPRRVSAAELRAFLLDRLALRGPFWEAAEAAARLVDLGMVQIDSIRVTGLRNQELAWAARADAPAAGFDAAVHGRRGFLEMHYPVFATRRDWAPLLVTGVSERTPRGESERAALRPLMRRLTRHIRAHGPATPGQFVSERIPGGFNTVKATTRALDQLLADRVVQISGRTANFHRIFDLTERVAPELVRWRRPARRDYERFLVATALATLKVATADQLAARVALHYGQWRGVSIRHWRAVVDRLLRSELSPGGAPQAVVVADLPDAPVYWHLAEDEAGWERSATPDGGAARIVPPLDNLLFSRRRLGALFDFAYKFEAYTPAADRRFYFAMPILHGDDIAGLLDARRAEGVWEVRGLELRRPVPPEALRRAIHRLAGMAGADSVAVTAAVPRALARTLRGRIERADYSRPTPRPAAAGRGGGLGERNRDRRQCRWRYRARRARRHRPSDRRGTGGPPARRACLRRHASRAAPRRGAAASPAARPRGSRRRSPAPAGR